LLDTGHHRLGLHVTDPDTGSVRDDLAGVRSTGAAQRPSG
jgi:hypothetical protein